MDQQRKEINVNGDHMTFGGAKMSNGTYYEWNMFRVGVFPAFLQNAYSMMGVVRYVIRNAVL